MCHVANKIDRRDTNGIYIGLPPSSNNPNHKPSHCWAMVMACENDNRKIHMEGPRNLQKKTMVCYCIEGFFITFAGRPFPPSNSPIVSSDACLFILSSPNLSFKALKRSSLALAVAAAFSHTSFAFATVILAASRVLTASTPGGL